MFRERLVRFLNKAWYLQMVFCYMPVILITVYMAGYLADVGSLTGVLENNNKVTKSGLDRGRVKPVSFFEEKDGVYSAIISADETVEESVKPGETIYDVYIENDCWYRMETKSGHTLYQIETELFGVEPVSGGGFLVKESGGYSFERNPGDFVCSVHLNKDNEYEVLYYTPPEKVPVVRNPDMISSLTVASRGVGAWLINVSTSYEKKFDGVELNFCNNLPDNGVYYNEDTESFVKNAASDFSVKFVLGSNIITMLVSVILYWLMLFVLRQQDKSMLSMGGSVFNVLRHKEVLIVDLIAVLLLLLCAFVPFLLF